MASALAACGDGKDDGSGSGDGSDQAKNHAPSIGGVPPTAITADEPYSFTPTAADTDGDSLIFATKGLPPWAEFDSLTGQISGVPTASDAGTYHGVVISVTDGTTEVPLPAFDIVVEPATPSQDQPPTISGTPSTSDEVGTLYSFRPSAKDPDGDPVHFTIQNRPAWTTFDAASGLLQGTPTSDDLGDYQGIVIAVSDGQQIATLPPFTLTVGAAGTNEPPTISGTPPTSVSAGTRYAFTPTASDPDGDSLTFSIQSAPSWASFDSGTGRLSGTPTADDAGDYRNIVISVSDGEHDASLTPFTLTVTTPDTNAAPTISGSPKTSVTAGKAYAFTPAAADADGDVLTFSIASPPAWASFDASTGALAGTPSSNDVGTYAGITISVSDGQATASLPAFTLTVSAPPNTAPTISGSPSTSVTAGQAYSFTPTASDADGDTLSFTIQHKPAWASFSASTGKLSGKPLAGNVGTYSDIVIAVTDGSATRQLPAFDITVEAVSLGSATLTWTAPTQRTDGTALTNLAGYKIYWGQQAGSYTNEVTLGNPGLTTYVIDDLGSGT
ncbi:MAG TPA: putative Ig domain-containing protein, partial [Gammaproteobacteria bacterium]|nr:putative Ig domain-containing protein [Gammaproteobacteria bacterium]